MNVSTWTWSAWVITTQGDSHDSQGYHPQDMQVGLICQLASLALQSIHASSLHASCWTNHFSNHLVTEPVTLKRSAFRRHYLPGQWSACWPLRLKADHHPQSESAPVEQEMHGENMLFAHDKIRQRALDTNK